MEETERIYTGPTLVAKGLVARLNDIGISPIERTGLDSNTMAGFTAGIANQTMLYLRKDQLQQAQSVIDEFLRDMEEGG